MRPVMPAIGRLRFGTYLLVLFCDIVACVTQALLDIPLYLDYIAGGGGKGTDVPTHALVRSLVVLDCGSCFYYVGIRLTNKHLPV